MKILVLSCRIHAVEYELFEIPESGSDGKELCRGVVEKIGLDTAVISCSCDCKPEMKSIISAVDHQRAVESIIQALTNPESGLLKDRSEINAVGHRVVHGGSKYLSSVIINEEVKREIYNNFELAPLHNPYNYKGIEAIEKLLPGMPQVAVFDTSFHQTLPEIAYRYPLPEKLYQQYRIRRYGFHGISHRYVTERVAALLKLPIEKVSLISLHLGAGSSVTAIKNGASIDTSMGFTPMEGTMMDTRSGNIDPGIIFFLHKAGWTINDIESCLNRESGVLGVSSISDETRDVSEEMLKGDPRAKLAIEMSAYRLKRYIGAFYAVMRDVPQAIAFTGGIGANNWVMREEVCAGLEFMGIKLDQEKNKSTVNRENDISLPSSLIKIFVIPGDEKLVVARDVAKLIKKG